MFIVVVLCMLCYHLIPVATSVNLLQRLIDTCCEFEEAVYLDIKFNALKSNIIRYGPKCTDLNIKLHVGSIAIPCVNRLLGMNLKRNF